MENISGRKVFERKKAFQNNYDFYIFEIIL